MIEPEDEERAQPEFEQLCGQIDEYEPLPTAGSVTPPELTVEAEERIDAEILAGLVSP
jgi:hypothetical protein